MADETKNPVSDSKGADIPDVGPIEEVTYDDDNK